MKNRNSIFIAAAFVLIASGSTTLAQACSETIRLSTPVKGADKNTRIVNYQVNNRSVTVTDDDGVFMTMLAYQYAVLEPIDPGGKENVMSMPYDQWAQVKEKNFGAWKGPLGDSLRESMARTVSYFQDRAAAHPEEKAQLESAVALEKSFKGKSKITYSDLSTIGTYLDGAAKEHGYTAKTGGTESYYPLVENNSENPVAMLTGNFAPFQLPPNLRSRCPVRFPQSFADITATSGSGTSGAAPQGSASDATTKAVH